MKRESIIIAVVGIMVAMSSCGSKSDDKSQAMMKAPEIDVAVPTVDSVVLHQEYPGVLIAANSVDLVARVDGYQRYSGYTPGETVAAGTVLFRIEDTQYQNAVKQASAQLETARATNTYNTDQYNAMKKALASDAVSQMSVIQAESNMKESRAAIASAEAALKTAQTNLGYCVIRAPFSGKVTVSEYSDGTYLSGAGQPVKLATIYDDTYVRAVFAIEDSRYMQMIKDAKDHHNVDYDNIPIEFSDALPHQYTGKLDYMSPEIDESTGTMSLRAKIMNPYGELKAGMYCKIALPYGTDPKAILVKDASIGSDQLGKYLYVVNDSNKVVYTPIQVGELVNDTLRIVTGGITPQTRYVTKALLKVRDGMKVKPHLTK